MVFKPTVFKPAVSSSVIRYSPSVSDVPQPCPMFPVRVRYSPSVSEVPRPCPKFKKFQKSKFFKMNLNNSKLIARYQMMNHLIFSRFEPLVSNREIKLFSKMKLSIFSKMGKDPKKPKKDDATVKRDKNVPCPNACGSYFTSISNANQHAKEACPRKAGTSKASACEDCGMRFESERIKNAHKRKNVCGRKKRTKKCQKCGKVVLAQNWKRHIEACGHKCSKCSWISATDQVRLIF